MGDAMKSLLPCPFCGGAADWRWHSGDALWVECGGCGAVGPQDENTTDANQAKTRTAWNTRAQSPDPALQEEFPDPEALAWMRGRFEDAYGPDEYWSKRFFAALSAPKEAPHA